MTSNSIKTLGLFRTPSIFEKGIGAQLPEAYKKFYREWIETKPTAVHYIPEDGKWKRDEVTGEVKPIQDIPIPLIWPKEHNSQLWGGEGVIQGFQKRSKFSRRVPHFWVPTLRRSVVYSEVLNKYMSIVVTDRAIRLINTNYGFDHYLLKTPACDLKSLLALRLKRKILKDLFDGCPAYERGSEKHRRVLNEYSEYLSTYTAEEIDWYGYTFQEACKKMESIISERNKPVPLKHMYRAQLIEKLKAAEESRIESEPEPEVSGAASWLRRMNPFGKKQQT